MTFLLKNVINPATDTNKLNKSDKQTKDKSGTSISKLNEAVKSNDMNTSYWKVKKIQKSQNSYRSSCIQPYKYSICSFYFMLILLVLSHLGFAYRIDKHTMHSSIFRLTSG